MSKYYYYFFIKCIFNSPNSSLKTSSSKINQMILDNLVLQLFTKISIYKNNEMFNFDWKHNQSQLVITLPPLFQVKPKSLEKAPNFVMLQSINYNTKQ